MTVKIIAASTTVFLLASLSPVSAQKPTAKSKSEVKFIENIEVPIGTPSAEPAENVSKFAIFKNLFSKKQEEPNIIAFNSTTNTNTAVESEAAIEKANSIQFKYSLLLDTEVEEVQNISLYQSVDEWYGTPYVYGGTTKRGIDCSAFVQVIYNGIYGIPLPRTAREQQKSTRSISRTELKQGDLIFFNTTGGVSHVGIYLQNNKFVHAASSGGVMISDIFDEYWIKRFISAGRYEAADQSIISFRTQP